MSNEPAFPVMGINADRQVVNHPGMTLRDYFAAQALQGLLSAMPENTDLVGNGPVERRLAFLTYELADAMMKAREQQGE